MRHDTRLEIPHIDSRLHKHRHEVIVFRETWTTAPLYQGEQQQQTQRHLYFLQVVSFSSIYESSTLGVEFWSTEATVKTLKKIALTSRVKELYRYCKTL